MTVQITPENEIMELHEKIRALRTERGLSQKQLASALGVSDKTISKWECARGSIGLTELEKLSEALGVHTDDLLSTKVAEEKAFAPRRMKPDSLFTVLFAAASALTIAVAAWMGVLTAEGIGTDALETGWCHIAAGAVWIITASVLFRIKFRAEKIAGLRREASFGVRSALNVKRLYAAAGNTLALGTFLFECSVFCGVAFIAFGFGGIAAIAIRFAIVAVAIVAADVYYILSVKKIRADERAVSAICGSDETPTDR